MCPICLFKWSDHVKISIRYIRGLERPWLVKREEGTYEQHAHCYTEKDARKIRQLIDINRYPYSKEYKVAMQRLLTEEEFKKLDKKQRYYNVQKGVRR